MINTRNNLPGRILITTPIKDSWPSQKQKVLFLGEWCKLYKEKELLKKYNSITVPYHWDTNKKFNKDYEKINLIYENLIDILSEKLNLIHNVKLKKSSWRIIIGPWLGIFSQIAFDRWFMLKEAYENFNVSDTICLKYNIESQIPNDFDSFAKKYNDDVFNHIIYSEIIKLLGYKHTIKNARKFNNKNTKNKRFNTLKVKDFFFRFIQKISQIGSKNDNYLIIATCLNRFRNAFLQIRLGQMPRLWGEKLKISIFDIDLNKRAWKITYRQSNEDKELKEFIKILIKLIPLFMPRSYLEGFKSLNSHRINNIWPKAPKKIFTSSRQISDDIFKIWSAKKIENGSEFFLGQHGGHYGSSLISFLEDHQMRISKRFLSWGSVKKNNHYKFLNVGLFISDFYKLKLKPNSSGNILLIENEIPKYSYWMWSSIKNANHWKKYFYFNSTLIKNLPSHIKKKSIIRIYNKENYGYQSIKRWENEIHDINIDYCVQTLEKRLKKDVRIAISTTNTSTMLFTLAINFPTIIYWQPEYWEIRKEAKIYFNELEKVGILQTNIDSAIKHLENIWDNVDLWWNDQSTQKSRIIFCNQFAKIQKNDLNFIIRYLK